MLDIEAAAPHTVHEAGPQLVEPPTSTPGAASAAGVPPAAASRRVRQCAETPASTARRSTQGRRREGVQPQPERLRVRQSGAYSGARGGRRAEAGQFAEAVAEEAPHVGFFLPLPRVAGGGDAREVGTYVRGFFGNRCGELAGFSAPRDAGAGAGVDTTLPNS